MMYREKFYVLFRIQFIVSTTLSAVSMSGSEGLLQYTDNDWPQSSDPYRHRRSKSRHNDAVIRQNNTSLTSFLKKTDVAKFDAIVTTNRRKNVRYPWLITDRRSKPLSAFKSVRLFHKLQSTNIDSTVLPLQRRRPDISYSHEQHKKQTPLRDEWCTTKRFRHEVKLRGCLKTTILNNFCYGQCNSFFIPKKIRLKKNRNNKLKEDDVFMSCGFCQPRNSRSVAVTMRCPNAKRGLQFKRKRVQILQQCQCISQDIKLPIL